ncbi:MAG TPA: hypothetical protein VFR41_06865, partial [Acidimicrobiia bacterium]|nr:hypothetical protein [Acidimicrobiia bacterium]
MSDLLERELAARLDAVAATVPDELEPPASLEFEVAVRRRRARTHSRRTRVMALAAAIAVVAGSAAVIHTERSRSRVHVVAPPASDPLIAGTAMLGVHGRDVVALDRSGHLLATIVHAQRG